MCYVFLNNLMKVKETFVHHPHTKHQIRPYSSLFRFTLEWSITYLLSRSKRTDFGPHDWHSMPVSGAQTWLVVPGLEPGTEYQFSVLAQNKLGTGPFSEVVTVNTAGGPFIRSFSLLHCIVTPEMLHYHPTQHWRCCPLVMFEFMYKLVISIRKLAGGLSSPP